MAVIGHLHKVVFGGRLAVTDSWSVSLHFLSANLSPLVLSGLMASAVDQWFARTGSALSTSAKLDFLKANELNPAAVPSTKPGAPDSKPFTRYLDTAETNVEFFDGLTLPAGGSPGAPQLSLVVSTRTAALRGLASKGRFYPPTGGMLFNVSGFEATGFAASSATSAAQLITDLNGANEGSCVVFSQRGLITREITGVRVGNVVDTQRRRRKGLVETYTSVDVA